MICSDGSILLYVRQYRSSPLEQIKSASGFWQDCVISLTLHSEEREEGGKNIHGVVPLCWTSQSGLHLKVGPISFLCTPPSIAKECKSSFFHPLQGKETFPLSPSPSFPLSRPINPGGPLRGSLIT